MKTLLLILLVAVACPHMASAQRRSSDTVITAPTAVMPKTVGVTSFGRVDHRKGYTYGGAIGYGGVALLRFETNSDVRHCDSCTDAPKPVSSTRFDFRIGAPEGQWHDWQPALVLGASIASSVDSPSYLDTKIAQYFVVASKQVGQLTIHAGAMGTNTSAVRDADKSNLVLVERGLRIQPFGGMEWNPSAYPRTQLLADVSWTTEIRNSRASMPWIAGWGVRYWAGKSIAVELSVRHRQDEGLSDSTVILGGQYSIGKWR